MGVTLAAGGLFFAHYKASSVQDAGVFQDVGVLLFDKPA